MAQGHKDALAIARGTAWDHGYRLGMRMAEEARNPLPPKRALKPSTRKLLAAFPPAAEEVDLEDLKPRTVLGGEAAPDGPGLGEVGGV